MKVSAHLIVNSRGAMRVNKARPALGFDEISLALELNLPDELFKKPRLEAKITVPKEAVVSKQIEAGVVDNIEQAIKAAAGMEVKLLIVRPEDDEKDK